MKNPTTRCKFAVLALSIIFIVSCNLPQEEANNETPPPPAVPQAVCVKGLSYAACPNPPAMHGQIMVHNMSTRTYDVKLTHHENEYETKQIAPGDGWTFVGVLQGKKLIVATPSTSGNTYESSCTVIGNTQHMMNITSDDFYMVDPKMHAGH
jgi:hypothetical protein